MHNYYVYLQGDNMNFTVVVEQVLILLIILVVGIVSGKVGFIADGASKTLGAPIICYKSNDGVEFFLF